VAWEYLSRETWLLGCCCGNERTDSTSVSEEDGYLEKGASDSRCGSERSGRRIGFIASHANDVESQVLRLGGWRRASMLLWSVLVLVLVQGGPRDTQLVRELIHFFSRSFS
jgi:hypothetical protein